MIPESSKKKIATRLQGLIQVVIVCLWMDRRSPEAGLTVLELVLAGTLVLLLTASLWVLSKREYAAELASNCNLNKRRWIEEADVIEEELHRWEAQAPQCVRLGFVPFRWMKSEKVIELRRLTKLESISKADPVVLLCDSYSWIMNAKSNIDLMLRQSRKSDPLKRLIGLQIEQNPFTGISIEATPDPSTQAIRVDLRYGMEECRYERSFSIVGSTQSEIQGEWSFQGSDMTFAPKGKR